MYYLLISLAALLLAADFVILKIYQKFNGSSLKSGFFFNALNGLFTILIFFAINKFRFEFTWYSAFLAILFSFFCFLYVIIGIGVVSESNVAVYSLFLMGGGMTVPYISGIIFFDENFSFLRTIGLILILCSLILTGGKVKVNNKKILIWCVAIFFLNGAVGVFSKLQQTETNLETVSAAGFVILTALSKLIISALAFLFCGKHDTNHERNVSAKSARKLKPLILIGLSAGIGGISYFLQLVSLIHLPVTVQFPFLTGGSVILTAIISRFILKEKSDRNTWLGIFFCFAGTFMFL